MRISDWSSDVCSSDLYLPVGEREFGEILLDIADGGDADGLAERRRGDSQVRCNVEAGPDDDFGPLKVPVDARIAQKLDTPHGLQDVARRLIQLRRIVARQHDRRSEEHTSELQSLMRISYAVFCLKKKNITAKDTDQNDLQ